MILTWNSDQSLNLTRETRQLQKKLTMTSNRQMSLSSFQVITNLEQSGSWIPDTCSAKLKFSLIKTFYLIKTENRSEQSITFLVFLLSLKVLFLPKNADISKIKVILVLKAIFSKTTYVCVVAYHISSFWRNSNKF